MKGSDAYPARGWYTVFVHLVVEQGWTVHDAVRIITRASRHRLARHHLGPGDGGREPIQ